MKRPPVCHPERSEESRVMIAVGRAAGYFAALRVTGSVLLLVLWTLSAHALTLATYNVENYTIADRMVEGVYRQAYPKPEKEILALRQVINGMAPDILAVCEMGPKAFLEDFQRELKQSGQNYPYIALLEAADPARHVAVLSKVPFKEVRRHAKLPTKYLDQSDVVKRGALEVIVATSAGDLSVFVVHLKSKFTERKEDPESAQQRAAEAEAVRDLVLARFPDPTKALFIVCGDWNDTRTTRPVRALQKRGNTDIGELLRAADSRGETWTHHFRREDSYSRIDFIMVSPALKPLVKEGRGSIWDGPGTREASDHRPVVVKLELK